MKKLLALFMLLPSICLGATSYPSATVTVEVNPYCLAAASTVVIGYFVPSALTAVSATSITATDGSSTYVKTIAADGSTSSCWIKQ